MLRSKVGDAGRLLSSPSLSAVLPLPSCGRYWPKLNNSSSLKTTFFSICCLSGSDTDKGRRMESVPVFIRGEVTARSSTTFPVIQFSELWFSSSSRSFCSLLLPMACSAFPTPRNGRDIMVQVRWFGSSLPWPMWPCVWFTRCNLSIVEGLRATGEQPERSNTLAQTSLLNSNCWSPGLCHLVHSFTCTFGRTAGFIRLFILFI